MKKTTKGAAALAVGIGSFVATAASAHVSLSSGPAVANTSQEVTFSIAHGCPITGGVMADTLKLKIDIPAGVTSVRAGSNSFGAATFTKDAGTGNVTSVTWQNPAVAVDDQNFYKFTLRMKPPNTPFVKLYFPAHQTCKDGAGEVVVDWVGTPGQDAGAEPAPEMLIMPARQPGWNKYTIPEAQKDMSAFKDALIVWRGTAAYSLNPNTLAQIKAEQGVTELTDLKANDEIWVRY